MRDFVVAGIFADDVAEGRPQGEGEISLSCGAWQRGSRPLASPDPVRYLPASRQYRGGGQRSKADEWLRFFALAV